MVREWLGWLRGNSPAGPAGTDRCRPVRGARPRSTFTPSVLQLEDRVVPSGFAFVSNEAQLASAITAANQGGANPTIIELTNNIALTTPLPTLTGSMSIEGMGHTLGSASGASGSLGFGVLNIAGAPGAVPTIALTDLILQGGTACNGGGVYAANANVELILDTFQNCSATGSGGAVAFTDPLASASLQVNTCTFEDNCAAGCGGAIAFMGSSFSGQSLVMGSSNFIQNAAQCGGAISFTSVQSTGMVNINSCNFSGDVSWANSSITNPTQLDGTVDASCSAFVIGWGTVSGGDNLHVTAEVAMVSYTTFNGGTSVFNPANGFGILSVNASFINGATWYWNGVQNGQGFAA